MAVCLDHDHLRFPFSVKAGRNIGSDQFDPVLHTGLKAGGDGGDQVFIRADIEGIAAVAHGRKAVALREDPPQISVGQIALGHRLCSAVLSRTQRSDTSRCPFQTPPSRYSCPSFARSIGESVSPQPPAFTPAGSAAQTRRSVDS